MNLRNSIKDFFIIFSITCTLFISFEIILRIIFPEKILKQDDPASKEWAYQFNKDYLISIRPKYSAVTFEGAVWETNKNSFRGEEMEEHPDIRIIVYGDSNVEARFSSLEDTFPYKLEKYLKESSGKDVEVLNAGVAGFGPDQSLIRFSKEADVYKPDIVIFHIFADNDFGDIIRNRLFELDANGKLIATGFKKEPDELLKKTSGLKNFISSLLLVRGGNKILEPILPKKTMPVEADDFIDLYMSVLKEEYQAYKEKQPQRFSHFADHFDLDIAASPDAESSKIKIKLMENILREAKNLAAEKGVEFIVLIQPSVIDSTENFSFSYKDLQKKFPWYKRTNLTDAVDNICNKNDIHGINLFDIFQKNKPEELFFKGGNNHWNKRGQDVAAREVSAYILRNIIQKTSSH